MPGKMRACCCLQDVRTTLDQKMMHNVNTAVQQADALLVIVDATSDLQLVLQMPGMAPGWRGPPAALVPPPPTSPLHSTPSI